MYAVWWLVISFGVLLLLSIISIVIGYNISEKTIYDADWLLFTGVQMSVITSIAFIITLLFAILMPLQARKEYNEYINTYELVQELYDNDKTLENAGLTLKVIELNQWLTSAKASNKTYGNWSMYCTIDLDNLEYIKLTNTKDTQ